MSLTCSCGERFAFCFSFSIAGNFCFLFKFSLRHFGRKVYKIQAIQMKTIQCVQWWQLGLAGVAELKTRQTFSRLNSNLEVQKLFACKLTEIFGIEESTNNGHGQSVIIEEYFSKFNAVTASYVMTNAYEQALCYTHDYGFVSLWPTSLYFLKSTNGKRLVE